PGFTSTGGLDFRFPNGWNGGIGYRYMHNRPANEDNTIIAQGYRISDLTVNYTKKRFELGLAVENLFNSRWNESQFDYTSRLKYETAPVNEVSYTPGAPFFIKLQYARFF
ncbi:MAG TPA: TonB-dependent receptor, partial [Puia sp.]|nr:TonB-dependent receptor [Puia sp.]